MTLKYGPRLRAAFALDGGDTLRRRIDEMPNGEYQSLLRRPGERDPRRAGWPARGRRTAAELARVLAHYSDEALPDLIGDLAGHDLGDVIDGLERCDAERRAAERHLRVHGQGLGPADRRPPDEPLGVLTGDQIDALRVALADPADEWAGFDPDTPEAALCCAAARAADRAGATRPRDASRRRRAGRARRDAAARDLVAGGVRPHAA